MIIIIIQYELEKKSQTFSESQRKSGIGGRFEVGIADSSYEGYKSLVFCLKRDGHDGRGHPITAI